MRAPLSAAAGVLAAAFLVGCTRDVPKRYTVEVKEPPAIDRVKVILTDYATGTPVGSEVLRYDDLVQGLKATHPDKAILVHEAFNEFRKQSGKRVDARAKQVLAKL